jgi:hypothetical protein
MVESSWPTSDVTQEHLQNLVSQGHQIVAELASCHVPVDPASPSLVGGYVIACVAFYGLELHHLTPLGFLHIVALVTLCEAYMGIEIHFDLWNYFFRVWLRPGLATEASVWGSVDIFVRYRSGVNPSSTF